MWIFCIASSGEVSHFRWNLYSNGKMQDMFASPAAIPESLL